MDKKFCNACGIEVDARGWNGHSRSKKHAANVETMGDVPVTVDTAVSAEFVEEVITNPDLALEYEKRIRALEAELEEASPNRKSPMLTADNVEAVVGRERLEETAELQLVSEQRSRRREDRRPLWENSAEFEDLLKEKVAELKVDLVAKQTRFAKNQGNGSRTMKMARRVNINDPSSAWMSVQLPVEDQINNGAAAPGQGVNIHPFRDDKGFKILEPYRCELADCWAVARYPQNSPKFCGPEHAALIPKALEAGRRAEVVREYAAR